jgi:hypothetical protein
MEASDWIAIFAAAVAVASAGAAIWQARHARTQATAAKIQATAAEKQADEARQTNQLQEKIWRDSAQPYVYADIRPDPRNGVLLLLVIENTGRTIAQNVRVTFTPPLESSTPQLDITSKKALNDAIASMPPGARITHYVDRGFSLHDSDKPKHYHVKITGDGPSGPMDDLEYEIDLTALLDSASIREGSMRELAKAIEALTKKLK